MTDTTYPPSAKTAASAHVNLAKYDAMYAASISDPNAFWAEHGKRIDWIKPFTQVKDTSFEPGNISINWFADGTLNVSANCIDRHLATRADQTAIIWEPDNPDEAALHISYRELHANTCRMSNILKSHGCRQGRSCHHLYANDPRGRLCHAGPAPALVPFIPSYLHGFSADALAARVNGSDAKVVITADLRPSRWSCKRH